MNVPNKTYFYKGTNKKENYRNNRIKWFSALCTGVYGQNLHQVNAALNNKKAGKGKTRRKTSTVYRETEASEACNMHNDCTKLRQQRPLLRRLKLLIVRSFELFIALRDVF